MPPDILRSFSSLVVVWNFSHHHQSSVEFLVGHPVYEMRNECLLCQPPNLSSKRDANWQIYETKRRLYFPRERSKVCTFVTRQLAESSKKTHTQYNKINEVNFTLTRVFWFLNFSRLRCVWHAWFDFIMNIICSFGRHGQ